MSRVLFILGVALLAAPVLGALSACGGLLGPCVIVFVVPAVLLGPFLPDAAVVTVAHGPDVLSLLGIVLVYVLPGTCFLLLGAYRREPGNDVQQTLDPLPDATGIASMSVANWRQTPSDSPIVFEVPHCCWDAILCSLSPCHYDPHPCPRRLLAHLQITTICQETLKLHIYSVDDYYPAAFSFGKGIVRQRHYRGGSAKQIRQALAAAYAAFSTANTEPPQNPATPDDLR